jgi:hypothetical protein
MALTTLASVKQWLGIDNTTNDALLQSLIDSCSDFIEQYLNRKILSAEYTELIDGTGATTQTLKNYPITAVSLLSINNLSQSILPVSNFNTTGVKFDERQLIGQNVKFTCGKRNIYITYTAGYAAVPKAIEQACNEMIAMKFKNERGDRFGVSSKSLAGESISFFHGDMTQSVRATLDNYRNVVPL